MDNYTIISLPKCNKNCYSNYWDNNLKHSTNGTTDLQQNDWRW